MAVKLKLTGVVVGEDIGMHVQDGPSYYHPFVTAARCVASGMSHNLKCTVVSRLSKSASLLRGLRKSGRDG